MLKARLLLLALSFADLSLTHDMPKGKSDILFTARNAKYHLLCAFHGAKVRTPSGNINDVKYVTVSDERTGQTVRFKPLDMASLESALLLSGDDVWSPDKEWLVLPLGQFDGFQLIRARSALAELKSRKPVEFVRLEGFEGGPVWHRFSGWTAPASFHIIAGGEERDKHWQYRFDLNSFSLVPETQAKGGVAESFVTSKGKSQVQ